MLVLKEISRFILPIIVFQAICLWALHSKAEYRQVTKSQAIQALKRAPNGAEVYQCFKRVNVLDCKRVKLAIVRNYDLKLK